MTKEGPQPEIEVEKVDDESPDPLEEDGELDFNEFKNTEIDEVQSKATLKTGGRSSRKPRKSAMIVDNNFVHAKDFKTPMEYLNQILHKQTTEGGNETSFGAEIFEKVKVEYDAKLRAPVSDKISRGHFDHIFPQSDTQQDISDINKKLAIQ